MLFRSIITKGVQRCRYMSAICGWKGAKVRLDKTDHPVLDPLRCPYIYHQTSADLLEIAEFGIYCGDPNVAREHARGDAYGSVRDPTTPDVVENRREWLNELWKRQQNHAVQMREKCVNKPMKFHEVSYYYPQRYIWLINVYAAMASSKEWIAIQVPVGCAVISHHTPSFALEILIDKTNGNFMRHQKIGRAHV